MDNQDKASMAGIDSEALKRCAIEACRSGETMQATDGQPMTRASMTRDEVKDFFTHRPAADLAAQLERDATSLTLTGVSFAKDKAFYDAVAANVREAVAWLKNWQPLIEQLQKEAAQARRREVGAAYANCTIIAREIRDVVPAYMDNPRASGWRTAADAIRQAVLAGAPQEPKQ